MTRCAAALLVLAYGVSPASAQTLPPPPQGSVAAPESTEPPDEGEPDPDAPTGTGGASLTPPTSTPDPSPHEPRPFVVVVPQVPPAPLPSGPQLVAPVPQYVRPPGVAPALRPAADPTRRGTAEVVELYVVSGLFGGLTGAYIPFVASEQRAGSTAYALSMIGGAAVFVTGAVALDLTGALRPGTAPAISSSIRFGVTNGMLAMALAAVSGVNDSTAMFSLVWGGAAAGAAVGLGVGLGLNPSVREVRVVESLGIWGAGLGASAAMIVGEASPEVAAGLPLVSLNVGLLGGLAALTSGTDLSTRRVLFLDLGFLAGFGAGVAALQFYNVFAAEPVDLIAFGVGSLIGSVAGWSLLYLVTDGMEGVTDDMPSLHVSVSPRAGGGVINVGGAL